MRLFTRKHDRAVEMPEAPPCLHMGLTARWDSVEDMGNEAKATSFVCPACNGQFTPAQAAEIRATQADQLRRDLAQ